MTAPERIYLDGDAEAGDGYFTRCFETAKPCSEPAIEYVRADLCDPMQDERVKRLVEASARLVRVARQNTDDAVLWEKVCGDVDAALSGAYLNDANLTALEQP